MYLKMLQSALIQNNRKKVQILKERRTINHGKMKMMMFLSKKREADQTKQELNQLKSQKLVDFENERKSTQIMYQNIKKLHQIKNARRRYFDSERQKHIKNYFNKQKQEQERYIFNKIEEIQKLEKIESNLLQKSRETQQEKDISLNELNSVLMASQFASRYKEYQKNGRRLSHFEKLGKSF